MSALPQFSAQTEIGVLDTIKFHNNFTSEPPKLRAFDKNDVSIVKSVLFYHIFGYDFVGIWEFFRLSATLCAVGQA